MPNTNFIDKNTVITADYMNQVDHAIFDAIGDGTATGPTTGAEVKTNLGLNNVDNTSDANKPISTATQTALDDIDTALGLKAATATTVQKDSNTGAAQIPVGTAAQRPTGANGKIRYNSDTDQYEGYTETVWAGLGGAQANGVIYENSTTITADYTLTTGKNGLSVGPITVADGALFTVPPGARYVVL